MNDFANAHQNFQQDVLTDEKSGFGAAGEFFGSSTSSVRVRPEFSRENYDFFRPGEALPKGNSQADLHKIMDACVNVYERVGIIRSVIDMMSEFASEGVRIIHPDKEVQNFYDSWAKMINLPDRAERLGFWLLTAGNAVIRRKFAKISDEKIRQMRNATAEVDEVIKDEKAEKGRIPNRYVFYDPRTVDIVYDPVASLSDRKIYELNINLRKSLTGFKPKTQSEQLVFNSLPEDVKSAIEGKNVTDTFKIKIPEDKVFVGHYKKNDTEIWAKPFLYSVLETVQYNDKVRMAKISTLDNMISITRLWKLGDHTKDILPSRGSGAKLASILQNHTGGGPVDIIWTSDISLQEFYPPIENLKDFEEDNHSLLLALGVPEGLVGGENSRNSSATNTIGLKNLIKRVETIRRVIREWLQTEINIIHKNMGFRRKPSIRFANADLQDERTFYNLLIQLVDRNILSDDRILEIINEFPDIEKIRVQEQELDRDKDLRPEKTSPYHNPQLEMQQQHELNRQGTNTNNDSKDQGVNDRNPGRPPNSPDKVTRRRGPNRVRAPMGKVNRIYSELESFITSSFMNEFQVSNMRKLTSEQKKEIEIAINELFPHIHPDSENLNFYEIYQQKIGPAKDYLSNYLDLVSNSGVENITAEDKKLCKIMAYIKAWEGYN